MKILTHAFIVSAICCVTFLAGAQQGGLGALAQSGVEGAVVVIDLVKFRPDGAARYAIYDRTAEAKLKELGGSVIFRGVAAQVPGLPSDKWDRVTFRKYPSVDAVMAMGTSKEYMGAFSHRLASVAKSFVYAFSGELPSLAGSGSPGLDPMNVVPPPASAEAVYMLNLLRFKEDGGRKAFFVKYGVPSGRHIKARGGGPVLILKGIGPVIADEEVDRLILVMYPSAKTFREMVTSDEYKAILPLRAEAIELGLVWPFSRVSE